MEIKNGASTSFWYDDWDNMGRLWDLLGSRGHIDLGITSNSTVAEAIATHRRRRHRTEMLNRVEDELDRFRGGDQNVADIALWRSRGDKFK